MAQELVIAVFTLKGTSTTIDADIDAQTNQYKMLLASSVVLEDDKNWVASMVSTQAKFLYENITRQPSRYSLDQGSAQLSTPKYKVLVVVNVAY
jgi:hypothetical protein